MTTNGHYKRLRSKETSIGFALAGLGFLALGIYFSALKCQLLANVRSGRCTFYEGRISKISPESGVGDLAFEMSGHIYKYNTHHIALHQSLCDKIPVYVGDEARLCLSGNEIVRIDKAIRRINTVT
jgi:hypothetical protein